MITVGSSGTLGIGGMVITEGNGGRWGRRCPGGSAGAGACGVCFCCGGACPGGAAGGALLLGLLDEELVVPVVLVALVVLLVLDELLPGAVPSPPGPRLVSWMMPQITTASMTAMSPTQAINTGLRRNQGVGGCCPGKSPPSRGGAGCCSNWL